DAVAVLPVEVRTDAGPVAAVIGGEPVQLPSEFGVRREDHGSSSSGGAGVLGGLPAGTAASSAPASDGVAVGVRVSFGDVDAVVGGPGAGEAAGGGESRGRVLQGQRWCGVLAVRGVGRWVHGARAG